MAPHTDSEHVPNEIVYVLISLGSSQHQGPAECWHSGEGLSVPMASGKALRNTVGEFSGSQGLRVPGGQGQVGRLLSLAKQGRWDRAKAERTRSKPALP